VKRFSSVDTVITTSTTLEVDQSYYFTLDGIAGYTDFTGLFDQYRIVDIVAEAVPNSDTPCGVGMLVSPDYDDSASATYSQLLQYSAAVRIPVGKTFTCHIRRPAVDMLAYATGAGTRVGVCRRSPWLDCASSDIQHFGLKIAIPATPSVYKYNIQFTFYMHFRMAR